MIAIPMQISSTDALQMSVSASGDIRCTLGAAFQMASVPEYDGEYEFNPSSEAQTISTEGFFLSHDIIIDPIPPNYGLITWNGSTLTVS